MTEVHVDHPGEVVWYAGNAPAPVLGRCPHTTCRHDQLHVVAEGPDQAHYTLDQCDVPTDRGGCAGTCRAWCAPLPIAGGVRWTWSPFLHVEVASSPPA